MLAILVIIWVVRLFASTAFDKGLNKVLWGFIGAASYYVPVLICSFVISPWIIENFYSETTESGIGKLTLIFTLLNILVGVLCCIIAYQFLKRITPKTHENEVDIIDREIR